MLKDFTIYQLAKLSLDNASNKRRAAGDRTLSAQHRYPPTIIQTLARELNVQDRQIEAAVALLDGGATVPFIARYRKEATGGLDDTQLRLLEERPAYRREREERRGVILAGIRERGQWSADLETAIPAADTKIRLEDLCLPCKPKRRAGDGARHDRAPRLKPLPGRGGNDDRSRRVGKPPNGAGPAFIPRRCRPADRLRR